MLSVAEGEEERVPSLKRFGFVQTLDTQSQRRLYEVLQSQGLQMNQEITFLSDGEDTLRKLQLELSPKATHILDWLHLTMKLTVVYSTAADNSISAKIHYKALSSPPSAGALPWCRFSFSTTSGLWLWCAFSSCFARCGPVMPLPIASRSSPRSPPDTRAP